MTSYIVSTYDNGAMNVDSLRSFDNEVDARAYAASLAAKDPYNSRNHWLDCLY